MSMLIVVENSNRKIKCECWIEKVEKSEVEFVEIVSHNFNVCEHIHQYITQYVIDEFLILLNR